MTMKPSLSSQLISMNYSPISILTLPKNDICCVIGILYKEMKLKPSILHRIGGVLDNTPSYTTSYLSDDDTLYIEDENGKVKLDLSASKEKLKDLCSGLVVGLSGNYDGKTFMVHNMIFCGLNLKELPDLSSLPKSMEAIKTDDKFLALISGLNIDGSQEDLDYHINWVKQLLYGNMNNSKIVQVLSKICRIVIAGDSIKKEGFMENKEFMGAVKAQELYNKLNKEITKSLKALDSYLNELSKNVIVDILSGDHEPNTNFFPYQPLHRFYFEKAYKNNNFNAVTNPYFFELDGKKILGSSGHNIQDLRKSCLQEESDLKLLESVLRWGHVAPTAPETLR